MRKYELMVIFDLDEDTLDNKKKFVSDNFESNKISILEESSIGEKDFSYQIRNKNRGHYYLYNIEAEQPSLKELEKAFKLYKGILRYLIIRKSK